MKKNISKVFLISLLTLFIISCKPAIKTISISNIQIDVPADFEENFLGHTISADNTVEFYKSYGIERKTAIYTIVYTKYKPAYSGMVTIQDARNDIVNGLKNNTAIKEFQIVGEGMSENNNSSYEIVLSFYYGPNKTYHKSFSMLHENGILQVICMYNANSKKDDKQINDIIKSVRIIEDTENNN